MQNNFQQIRNLLKFENENEFYFIQIIERKKEHPELGRNNRLIKAYYVFSLDKFDEYQNEIIGLCEKFNARAYIHLNRRNAKLVGFEMMELLATNLKLNQFNQLSKLYNSVCGQHHSDKDKTWIIDIDEKNYEIVYDVTKFIKSIEPVGDKVKSVIPTKNGYHLITKPFNRKIFGEKVNFLIPHFLKFDIHTNNPTILFCL